jgi:three-Cys-motif partner protein
MFIESPTPMFPHRESSHLPDLGISELAMPLSDKPPYVPGADGHHVRISGDWAREKHHYLRNYCGITTKGVGGKFPGGVIYLDVMSGPGRCKEREIDGEFDGSPFVALDFNFAAYYFMEEDPRLFEALEVRLKNHPKRSRIKLFNEDWLRAIERDEFLFNPSCLVVAFVDPTGISQIPFNAIRRLMKIPRVDLLITIQYKLGIHLNVSQFVKSTSGQTALDLLLESDEWRSWSQHDLGQFTRRAVELFCDKIHSEGFKVCRHVSVPEQNPLYRFAYFSRHPRGSDYWSKITAIDPTGQRNFL